MIKIEIISVQPQSITVALYYPVPDAVYSLASKDDTRTPAGNGLSPQELQALKDGKLFELMKDLDPQSMTLNTVKTAIEDLWKDSAAEAKTEYIRAYSYVNIPNVVGRTWDGTSWS